MRVIYLSIVMSFLINCTSTNSIKEVQKIKEIQTRNLSYSDKIENFDLLNLSKKKFAPNTNSSYVFLNKNNDTIEKGGSTINGDFFYKELWIYNDKNQKIKELNLDKNNETASEELYFYNDSGQIIKSTFRDTKKDILINKTIYEYDKSGNNIKKIGSREDGRLSFRFEKKYDEKGNLIDFKRFHWTNTLSDWYQYTYENKKVVEKKELDSLGNEIQRWNYKYEFDNSDKTMMIKELYNDKLSQITSYKDSLIIKKEIVDYNKTFYKYSFDKNHNWVKKITFSNKNKTTYLTERTITYFK
ncbi:hypothetical protein GCM10022393_39660 [Aquimarina addita]|uniref:YD repeat-containing protein n=1 Tax=Aquimarina addita TaxID=870485 RepID=A0ABP6UWZ2_9FLAO